MKPSYAGIVIRAVPEPGREVRLTVADFLGKGKDFAEIILTTCAWSNRTQVLSVQALAVGIKTMDTGNSNSVVSRRNPVLLKPLCSSSYVAIYNGSTVTSECSIVLPADSTAVYRK